ncbi:MAG: M55 family metallopeptidase [Myxococcota bacterium]|nr:M55 family metallopeptidase [Myxococcota bacterium]
MKIFLSVDMEGISGLVRWMDVAPQGIDFGRNRRLMTLDANAAIEGAFAAGASEVVVEENHGVEDLCVLLMDEIDPRCSVVRGAGRPGATCMSALDESVDLVMLVGHHAAAASWPGIMAHTISGGGFQAVRLRGRNIGEPDIFTIRAGEVGAPVGLITGDQMVIEQVRKRVPNVEAVQVKRALGRQSGEVIPPPRAREAIFSGAKRAVERAADRDFSPYVEEIAPYEIEIDLRNPPDEAMRANLAGLPEFEIVSERTIATQAPDMDVGFRRIAYLGYARTPGVTRY